MTASSTAGTTRGTTRPTGRMRLAQGTKMVTCPRWLVNTSSAKIPSAFPPADRFWAVRVAWSSPKAPWSRVFLLLDDEDRIQEDYQLAVKPLAS
jgi:hypothetical protein